MKKRIKSYLSQLQFDPKLKNMAIASYLTNFRIVSLVVFGILIFGIFSFLSLPKRLNPEVKIPIVSVITPYPGAGPDEVEQLVTIPLENKLTNAKKLQTLSSSSIDNVSVITAEFSSGTEVDDARQEIQKLVAEVTDLPTDSLDPQIKELDFEDVPVWEFILTTNGSRASLEAVASIIEADLEANGKIDRLEVSGIEDKEIQVLVDPQKIADYSLTPIQLSNIISSGIKSLPAGKVLTQASSYSLSLSSSIDSIDAIRQLPLDIKGNQVYLGDIADVQYKSAADQKRSYVSIDENVNQKAVTLSVYKTSSSDITDAQQTAAQIVQQRVDEYGGSIQLIDLENVADDITEQFDELYSNFLSTIVLVFLTLFIFLGLRQAAIASLSIPLTFLISFIIMRLTGQTLNFLTLFSLLLALGLLVDDAIVIISAMTTYFNTKKFTPEQTGLLVWRDFLVPIWTTTITTVWAFVPLLLSSGIIGEFIKPIPVVVSATLLTSTSVAVLITLPLMIMLLKFEMPKRVEIFLKVLAGLVGLLILNNLTKGQPLGGLIFGLSLAIFYLIWRWRSRLFKVSKTRQNGLKKLGAGGIISLDKLADKYQKGIDSILRSSSAKKKLMAAVLIVSIFSYTLVPLGFVQNEFFPGTDTDLVFITLELPTGTNLSTTEEKALLIAQDLFTLPEVEMANLQVGKANRTSSQTSSNGDNLAAISLRLSPTDSRKITSNQVSKLAKEVIDGFEVDSKVYTETGGPPAGSDVTIKIVGKELGKLQEIANQIETELEGMDGAQNVDRSIKEGNSKIVFEPNLSKLNEYGLSTQDLSLWLRTAISGFELSEVDFEMFGDETKVKYYVSDKLLSPEQISEIMILSRNGAVPILELGRLTLEPAPSVITRENGDRTLTVTADVDEGYNAGEINTQLLEFAQNLDIPVGYSFATGGANEENQKSVQSIMQAMVLSMVLILATMVVQLGSFRKALIVILVIPLAISGVFIMFALTGTPLSFPALIGVLALFGIVVNNSIMVVDKINQNIAIGMQQIDAIVDAASSRLEPILFSSLTTIIGLIPITLSDPIWRGLGGAIISGLMFSGLVMLLVIPVVYTYFFRED